MFFHRGIIDIAYLMTLEIFNKILNKKSALAILALFFHSLLSAQQQYELNSGWKCREASKIPSSVGGSAISKTSFLLSGWMPAIVPGTVLTSMLYNKLIPDPFYGMNNRLIPDIYDAGRGYYTYWFVNDFTEQYPKKDEHVWLTFRGVNNSCDVFINGHQVNIRQYKSMYLRQEYDITAFLAKDRHNRLAVIVYPPDPVGNPNGGQGGDGTIAHNITNQYVAGWDWIQPVHDRNTGIWDKVLIKKTKQVRVSNTHIITLVPGQRIPSGRQASATIKVSAEVENTSGNTVHGTLQYELDSKRVSVNVDLAAHTKQLVALPDYILSEPKLWWPNGYGPQNLYHIKPEFLINGNLVSDEEQVTFGIRELKAVWNTQTQSRELQVNGQKIFIKGGNRILSDEMLRFSDERYDAEIRYHHDMNLNLIRVWGGGITERPEFYDACDKYGLLVMQDFWVSGDCNGRWYDPLKSEDTNTRRNYPDDHWLLVTSMADQVRMLRNHPSLAIWCGGNEIRPPADVLTPLRDSLLPQLDGTRFFFEYSNDDSMSYKAHDGPYTIQPDNYFWEHRSWGFNSEAGSVGIGDYESLERFIPQQNMIVPEYDTSTHKWNIDSVWLYHKYIGYDSAIEAYGHPKDIRDFAMKAQLANYNQYRALIEGFTAHMWDWYTGVIIWKTQNPWTAMLGQMYDVYLDPNACLYGLSEGSKPIHIMYDPIHGSVLAVNNTFASVTVKADISIYEHRGQYQLSEGNITIPASSCTVCRTFNNTDRLFKQDINEGVFLALHMTNPASGYEDENIYALPDSAGSYVWLSKLGGAHPETTATYSNDHEITITIKNNDDTLVAFFNRISLVDKKTKKRILPVFCNNNYISVLPGQTKTVRVEFLPQKGTEPVVAIEGWNVEKQFVEIQK